MRVHRPWPCVLVLDRHCRDTIFDGLNEPPDLAAATRRDNSVLTVNDESCVSERGSR